MNANERLIRLAERRATLVARAAGQRATLAQAAAPWRKTLALADHGLSLLRHAGRHPLLLAGAVGLFVLWRPRSLLRWTQRGWLAWRVAAGIRRRLSDS